MTSKEFLNSILTTEQIADIESAIKNKQPILIARTNSHGKTALYKYLRKIGAIVYEPHEMHVVEIRKDAPNFIPNVLDALEDLEE